MSMRYVSALGTLLALSACGPESQVTMTRADAGPGTDAAAADAGPMGDGGRAPVDPERDTDEDGLRDGEEVSLGTDPRDADTDADGFPDGVEVVAGTDPLDPRSALAPTDFYVVLPYEAPGVTREMPFRARLGRADIFFLLDTTGSMHDAINNVRASLSRVIVPRIADAFFDTRMGVADFQDFPVAPYGGPDDHPALVHQGLSHDVDAVQRALDGLSLGDGGDQPEALLEGVSHLALRPGRRADARAIIVAVTDSEAHNAPGSLPYYDQLVTAVSFEAAMAQMNDAGIGFVGVAIPRFSQDVASDDLEDIARATGSLDSQGEPLVRTAPGGGVSSSIVSGVAELVSAITQDVAARSLDDGSDAIDATRFISAIRPASAERAERFDEQRFYGVAGCSGVTFEVDFENDFVPATDEVQIVHAQIEIVEPTSSAVLDRRDVYVVVPRADGGLI